MKRTFDQICADILGENIMTPTTPTPGQPQQPTQQTAQQTEEIPEDITKLFIAAKTPQEVNAAYIKLQQIKQQNPTAQPPAQQQQNAANKQP